MMNGETAWPAPRAAYIHVPFCRHRCGYCNFTLIAGRDDLVDRYLEALAVELATLGSPRLVDTLFIGGGTPTHLSPHALDRLLRLVCDSFPLAAGGEFSVEANPVDVDATRVDLLADHGVTRLSLGAQSFDDAKLLRLERDHRAAQVVESVNTARRRIENISLDLIFGAPGESLVVWRNDLERALELASDHVSTYGLTFERGTMFWNRRLHGELQALSEDTERDMYTLALDRLGQAGFEHYEVSNFARPGRRCRHNQVYWAAEEYFAAGPGAARYVDGRRETNHRSTLTYIKRLLSGQSPIAETETLSPECRAREALVLGLRRMDGVHRRRFAERTGFEIEQLAADAVRRHVEGGRLAWQGEWLRLTRAGLFVSDAIWPAMLGEC